MKSEIIQKDSFFVLGKLGSSRDGDGFVRRLWADANAHFDEVSRFAVRNPKGVPVGCWGAMSDFGMHFLPWEEDFTKGFYLAGVECTADAEVPDGWSKWKIPAFRYLRVECSTENPFRDGLQLLKDAGYALAGAVQDFTDPATGTNYMCFPILRL